MKTTKFFYRFSIIAIGVFTLFTSCQKNEIIEPATPIETATDTDLQTDQTTTTITDFVDLIEYLEADDFYEIGIGVDPRIYHIKKENSKAEELVALIRESSREGKPLKVSMTPDGDILDLFTLTEEQLEIWKLEEGAIYALLGGEEDITEERYSYNFSSYSEISTAFNYLKNQGCNSYYTPEVYPCITFQYKRNGCHARAHKMKEALENKYGKTCKKIFVFGRLNSGCGWTKGWRFHVAPLVYKGSTAYVIDPSLSNSPSSINSWKNTMDTNSWYYICSTYIKSGSYYLPLGISDCGAQDYLFDPYMSHTNASLSYFANFQGCN